MNAKDMIRAVHNALLSLAPEKLRYVMLENSCRKYGVRSVIMDSHLGSYEGALQDAGMFRLIMKAGEPWWPKALSSEVAKQLGAHVRGTYIDIGANIGTTIIPFALEAPGWSFFAFEPDPGNFMRLRINLIRNKTENVRAYNLALADKSGDLTLIKDPTNYGDSWLSVRGDESEGTSVKVKAETLDRVMAGMDIVPPIVVKIDAQGAEPLIFKGGHDLLARASLVIMEFWPYGISRLGGDPFAFFQEVQARYAGCTALEGSITMSPHKSKVRIECVIAAGTQEFFDLILTRPIP